MLIVIFIIIKVCNIELPCFSPPPPKDDVVGDTSECKIKNDEKNINNTQSSPIIVHEPENEKENPFIIIFVNPGIGNKSILIDSNKSIEELIRFYFEVIKRQDLYGDKNISFLKDAKVISPPYPKESIETLTNKIVTSKTLKIVVADLQDKMKN